jgi:hypothetical protein
MKFVNFRVLRAALVMLVVTGGVLFAITSTSVEAERQSGDTKSLEAVISDPDTVNTAQVATWVSEGFDAVVLILDERFEAAVFENAAKVVAASSLDLYYWIEVGRNPVLATEHPEWIASLGSHDDWRKRFPTVRELADGEVAKAWPWTPIGYREAFDAHLSRIKRLLQRVPAEYRGLLLNDLQGGPSSCGCGNLQCRWALDYHVPATTDKLPGVDVAARFVAEVGKLAPNRTIVPVWTTECEKHDLAPDKLGQAEFSSGYCGSVDCFNTCRDRIAEQWTALHAIHHGPTGILALHKELQRDRNEYGGTAQWVAQAVDYVDRQQPAPVPHQLLWLVVQGFDVTAAEERAAREAGRSTGAGAVLVARTPIEQSYEPRIVKAASK